MCACVQSVSSAAPSMGLQIPPPPPITDSASEVEDEFEASSPLLLDFPREKLRVLEDLGQGRFGQVHLCETEQWSEHSLVAVKWLAPGAPETCRYGNFTPFFSVHSKGFLFCY